MSLLGSAGPGSRPSYRAAERGAGAASVHREQRGGGDPGRCQIQAERGPEGHPGRYVDQKSSSHERRAFLQAILEHEEQDEVQTPLL